ncbi:AAA family ATPase [Microcoleus sp. FACHB-53]|nr:AAA family ATPase [Microcoleus sp. FACHB-53]
MSNTRTLTWSKVEYTAQLAFDVWGDQREVEWAKQAWESLIKAGLTTYSTKTEYCHVIIRFFALIDLYLGFSRIAWGKYIEPDYFPWAKKLQIHPFQVGQLIAGDPNWNLSDNENRYEIGLKFLAKKYRSHVTVALLDDFGSESKLFVSLYRIGETYTDPVDCDEGQEESYSYKTDQEIMNKATAENSLAFEWLTTICSHKVIRKLKLPPEPQSMVEEFSLNPEYSLFECADDTGFEEAELEDWVSAIERKGQAIIHGSPGTGKTYIADKLAKQIIGGSDGFMELVQFHPAYAYEDFIQGIRPQARLDGRLDYQIVSGRFLEFCKKAEFCEGLCVLIIDEINRANLAQVFGELMYLLEYRDKKIPLAGSSKPFGIPENVRIIGTMNTADRSIALVDHALRRRFAFIELRPNYNVLRRYHQRNTGFPVDGLIETLKRLNKAIADKHYEVGISYFLTENLAEEIEDIWQMEIEPYLEEYFYDQLDKVDEFRWGKIKPQLDL